MVVVVDVAKLLKDHDGKTYVKDVRVEDTPEQLKGLLNETRWKILTLLAERPRYPAAIADELGVHEQNVYYHIRELEAAGIIDIVEQQERGGAIAKYYGVRDYGFVLELPFGEERLVDFNLPEEPETLRSLITPFVANGNVNARIVVGSPDPHGPHQVRSRDAHLATDIGLFLGQYGSMTDPATVLDVDLKSSGDTSGNLVLLGGPLTNMITADVNAHLPIKFRTDQFPFRNIVSEQSGNEYTDDAVGFISKAPNPDDPESSLLIVAGVRMKGTRAAVLALTQYAEKIFAGYEGEDKWGVVVQGKDMDGDGRIDDVEVLE